MAESEGTGSSSTQSAMGAVVYFKPNPMEVIANFKQPIKNWPFTVEMIVRIVLLVFLLILFIASSVAEDETSDLNEDREYRSAQSAAGFSIFIGVIAFIYEVLFLVIRILNFLFIKAFRTVVFIVDIIFHGVCALLLFASAVSLAYYANSAKDDANAIRDGNGSSSIVNILDRLGNALGGAAFFAFMSLFTMIFIAVWMVLYLVMPSWGPKGQSKADGGSSS